VADVQLEQGRGFDPWYLYDAHRAYRDALVIDPVNDKARAGLLQSLREMRKDAERDPAFSTWAKWLEAVSDSLEVPLIASNEANVKELGTLASTVRRGMIDAIRQLVETARAKGGTDAWDKSWLAIRQALDMPPVINSPDDQRTLRELREQVAPNISPDLRP